MSTVKDSGVKHPRHKALLDGTPYRGRSVMDLKAKKSKVAPAKKAAPKKEKAESKSKKDSKK